MDVNHRERVSHNSSTNELGLWLPSGSPKDQKNNDLSRHKNGGLVFRWTGFAGKTLWEWLQLLGVLALPLVITFVALYTSELLYSRQAKIQPPPSTSTYQSDTDMLGLRDKITWDAPVVKDQSIAITISLVPIPSRSTSLQNAAGSGYDFSLIAQLSASAFAIDPKAQEQQLFGQQNSFTWTAIPLYTTKQALNIYVTGIWTPKNGGKTIERPLGNHVWHIDVTDVVTPFLGLGQITLSEIVVVLLSSILNVPVILDFLQKRQEAREKERATSEANLSGSRSLRTNQTNTPLSKK